MTSLTDESFSIHAAQSPALLNSQYSAPDALHETSATFSSLVECPSVAAGAQLLGA